MWNKGLFSKIVKKKSYGQKEEKLKSTFMKKALVKITERYPDMTYKEKIQKAEGLWQKYQKINEGAW